MSALELDELLALLPDNTTGAIDAADLRTIVTELFTAANTYAQTFGYLWQAAGTTPASGKCTVTPPWGLGSSLLLISETTEDGHNLVFTLLDSANARVILSGTNGGILHADIIGPSVDVGSSREVPISVTSVTGLAPLNGEKMAVTILAYLP
jgi:hypothetical protein